MKNIHILPTDKPSRLHTYFNLPNYLFLSNKALNWKEAKHIYITSDERIERGDWLFDAENEEHIYRASDVDLSNIRSLKSWYCKKVILTTDQDLIKDGVQAIDDEFLEWFIKNPSCEDIEVVKFCKNQDDCPSCLDIYAKQGLCNIGYKIIIIPKEEPFKHEMRVLSKEEVLANRSSAYEFIDFDKQETLEEAAEKYTEFWLQNKGLLIADAFNAGVKWQQEQIGKSEFLQKLRATKSDAEARRLIFEQFKNK